MRLFTSILIFAALSCAADIYSGKWASSQSGGAGDIRITLKPEPAVVFTLNGQDIATKVVSSKSEGEVFEIAYDFRLEDYRLRSALRGKLNEGKLPGKYETTNLENNSAVDAGTFETSPSAAK